MLGMAAQSVTLNPGSNPSYSKELPREKRKKKPKKQHIKTHMDDGEQVPNLLINFRAHRGDPHKKLRVSPKLHCLQL